jgi:acetate CoA/acetoacetate CoA-transferase alpha subunit
MSQRLQGPAGIDKSAPIDVAMASLRDGMTILVGGFGERGFPFRLIEAVLQSKVGELTIVKSDANEDGIGVGHLIEAGHVKKMVASHIGLNRRLIELMQRGDIEVEICPQGILAERIRAGGAGLGGVLSDIGIETILADGKQRVTSHGREYLVEPAIRGDLALIHAARADHFGNLAYLHAARNFNPLMAMAADRVVAEADEIVPTSAMVPDHVVTPGVFVDAVVSARQT